MEVRAWFSEGTKDRQLPYIEGWGQKSFLEGFFQHNYYFLQMNYKGTYFFYYALKSIEQRVKASYRYINTKSLEVS